MKMMKTKAVCLTLLLALLPLVSLAEEAVSTPSDVTIADTVQEEAPALFSRGYVRVDDGVKLYTSAACAKVVGAVQGRSVLYAVERHTFADSAKDMLRVAFVLNGQYSEAWLPVFRANVMSAGDVEAVRQELEANGVWLDEAHEIPLSAIAFAVEAPAVEEPAVEEPVVEEPAVEEPAVEEPAVEEPTVEEPTVEEPTVEEPAVEEPVVEEPAVEEPAVEEPAVEEPAVEEPTVEEPAVEEPTVEEPTVEEPTVEEPAIEEPAVEEPAIEEPTVEEPTVEEPAVEEPAVEEPAADEPTVEEPAADEPTADEPAVEPTVEIPDSDTPTGFGPAATPSDLSADDEQSAPAPTLTVRVAIDSPHTAFFTDDEVTMRAVVSGQSGDVHYQWQYADATAPDSWFDIEGATADTYTFRVNSGNCDYLWRVDVTEAE